MKKTTILIFMIFLTLFLTLTIVSAQGGGIQLVTNSRGWTTIKNPNTNQSHSVHVKVDQPINQHKDLDGMEVYAYSEGEYTIIATYDPHDDYYPGIVVIPADKNVTAPNGFWRHNYETSDVFISTIETFFTDYDTIIKYMRWNELFQLEYQLPNFNFPIFDVYSDADSIYDMVTSITGREVYFILINPDFSYPNASQQILNLIDKQDYAFMKSHGIQPNSNDFQNMDTKPIQWTYIELEQIGFPFDIVMPKEIYDDNVTKYKKNTPKNNNNNATKKPSISEFYTCLNECALDGSNDINKFPEGTENVHLTWVHGHIPYGAKYERVWTKDGKEWVKYQCNWDKNEAWTQVSLSMWESKGFASGDWKMTIYVDGVKIFSDGFTVKGNHTDWYPAGTFDRCFWE